MADRRRQVIWSPSARRALDEAIAYIAEDSADTATRVMREVLQAANDLARFSNRGRVVPELKDLSFRELFLYSYRLIYQVVDDQVRIVTLLHGARDFEQWRRGRQWDTWVDYAAQTLMIDFDGDEKPDRTLSLDFEGWQEARAIRGF